MTHRMEEWEVELTLLAASISARQTSVASGHRPNHKDPLTGELFMGELTFSGLLAPGASTQARLRIIATQAQIEAVRRSSAWTIWEGPHQVGTVRVAA